MEELLTRGWNDLFARDSGPFHLRLIIQPIMATLMAIRAGWAEARDGEPIFFSTLIRDPARTRVMLRNLWRIAGKVFLVALVLDVIYQLIVFQWIYPLQALIVATLLALVPCLVVRGVGNRLVTLMRLRHVSDSKGVPLNNAIATSGKASVTGQPDGPTSPREHPPRERKDD
jgi:hypothetical protein